MPLFTATAPTGESVRYFVPEGTTEQEALALASTAYRLKERGVDVEKETKLKTSIGGYASEIGKGLLSGAAGLVESAATGASFLLPEEQEQAARAAIQDIGAGVQEDLAPKRAYRTSKLRKFAEATGSTLPFIATGAFGGLGALGAGVGLGAAAGSGEAAKRAMAAGATEEQISEAAGLGLIPGLGETLVPFAIGKSIRAGLVARGLGKSIGEAPAANTLARLRRVATAAGGEGLQEASAEIAQNLISQGVYDPQTGTFAGTGESLGYGAGVGGLLAALAELAISRNRRSSPKLLTLMEEEELKGRAVDPLGLPAPAVAGTGIASVAGTGVAPIEAGTAVGPREGELLPPTPPAGPTSIEDFGTPQATLPPPTRAGDGTAIIVTPDGRAYREQYAEAELEIDRLRQENPAALQGDLFSGLIEGVKTKITREDLKSVGVALGSRPGQRIPKLDLANPAEAREAVNEILESAEKKVVAAAKLENAKDTTAQNKRARLLTERSSLLGLLTTPYLAPAFQEQTAIVSETATTEAAPLQDAQINITEQIATSNIEEQNAKEAARIATETEAAFAAQEAARIAQEDAAPEQAQAGFEQIREAQLEQNLAADAVADVAAAPAGVATSPLAAALQEADRTGREVEGQAQLDIAAISPSDPAAVEAQQAAEGQAIDEQLASVERTLESEEAAAVGQDQVQGEILGPQGGARRARDRFTETAVEPQARTMETDKAAVNAIKDNPANPAQSFFQGTSVADGLAALAESMSESGLNVKNAAAYGWVKANLSVESNEFVGEATRTLAAVKGRPLTVAAALKTSEPITPDTLAKLQAGDLRGAINDLTKVKEASVANVAKAIEKGLGNTKVVMASNVVNESGEAVAGLYDPRTDTITLNQDVTQSNHILLHEAMHAVTSHELTKNTPAATQMRNLFAAVQDGLDTAYGATNVDEFVAEAFSNPEFQAKLASISVKGDRITLWDKFTNIIGNIMRRFRGQPSIKVESAKDKVDSLIADLISPAPEYRNATILPSATIKGTNAKLADQLGKFVTSKVSPQDVAAVSGYMSQASVASRKLWLSALPLPAIANVIEAKMPALSRLTKTLVNTIQNKAGMRQKELSKVTDTALELERLAKKLTKDQRTALDDVIGVATTSRVDPDKLKSVYAFKNNRKGDSAKQLIWERSQPAWIALKPEAKKMYRIMRNAYAEQYTKLRETFEARIDVLETNPAIRKQIKDKLLEKVFGKDAIDPYFPLHRKGNYWLSYNARVPNSFTGAITTEPHYEAFASVAQRNLARLKLESGENEEVVQGTFEEFEKAARNGSGSNRSADIGTTFKVLNELKAAGIDPDTEQVVLNMLLDAMPERALASSLRTRKGTPGFEADAVKVFRERMPNIVSQTVNLQYETELSVLSEQVAEAKNVAASAAVNGNDRMYINQTADHLQEYIDFTKNPQLATWSKALKSAGFGMTLGWNVSSVLVNWTNIPVVVLPYLGGKYGYKVANSALYNAHKQFLKAPKSRELEGFNDANYGKRIEGPSLSNIDFSDPNLSPELKKYEALANLLDMRGQSNTTMMSEALETRDPVGGAWNQINATMGYIFHQGERLNRQVTSMATFDLELEAIAKKKYKGDASKITKDDQQAAAQAALDTTELTNSGALTETAPRLAQTNWGSVIAMYKRFGVSMLYLQARMAKQSIDNALPMELERIATEKYNGDQTKLTDEDKAEAQEAANLTKSIAKKQIAGLFASSAVMAGVQGLPLYGAVAFIMNTVFLDDEDEDFDTMAATFFGEGFYSGAINATMGVDVAPRIGMTNLIFRSLPNKEQDSLVLQGLELLAGPVYGVTARAFDGIGLINEGETRRGIEKMLPSFASNISKGFRYNEEGVTTLRGDPIVEDVGVMGAAAQLIGLAPASYTQQIERNSVDKRIDRNINSRRSKLLRKYYLAKKNFDFDEARDVEKDMQEFNREHPEVSIDADTKARSLKQHKRTSEKMRKFRGVSISSKREDAVLKARRDAGGFD